VSALLLARVAEQLYWASRYLERAEDTARLVRAFTEVIVDLPVAAGGSWEPLMAMVGELPIDGIERDEATVITRLLADLDTSGSVVASIASARENLRTTREVMPREAWETVNDLYLYSVGDSAAAVRRPARTRFCLRVVQDCQRLDGIFASSWSRDEAYEIWRLAEAIERADMTTRVVGVRAAALMTPTSITGRTEVQWAEVQWMGLLRSLSALQMYQRAMHQPVAAMPVLRFLMGHRAFPRSVAHCVARIREAVERLPAVEQVLPSVVALEAVAAQVLSDLADRADEVDGHALDALMDRIQLALIGVDRAVGVHLFGTASE
jgi:uncharacterized alpha-E superfamily protein